MAFTAHNIRFEDGTVTIPDAPHLLADVPWCQGAKRVLASLYHGAYQGKRIADLGCLEGGYALELARMGFDALGIGRLVFYGLHLERFCRRIESRE